MWRIGLAYMLVRSHRMCRTTR